MVETRTCSVSQIAATKAEVSLPPDSPGRDRAVSAVCAPLDRYYDYCHGVCRDDGRSTERHAERFRKKRRRLGESAASVKRDELPVHERPVGDKGVEVRVETKVVVAKPPVPTNPIAPAHVVSDKASTDPHVARRASIAQIAAGVFLDGAILLSAPSSIGPDGSGLAYAGGAAVLEAIAPDLSSDVRDGALSAMVPRCYELLSYAGSTVRAPETKPPRVQRTAFATRAVLPRGASGGRVRIADGSDSVRISNPDLKTGNGLEYFTNSGARPASRSGSNARAAGRSSSAVVQIASGAEVPDIHPIDAARALALAGMFIAPDAPLVRQGSGSGEIHMDLARRPMVAKASPRGNSGDERRENSRQQQGRQEEEQLA